MKPHLRLPAVLAVAVITTVATVALVTSASCGGDDQPTCDVYYVPDGIGGGENCSGPDPTCATGPNLDQCPIGCVAEPVV
jgi:hypothetical protein